MKLKPYQKRFITYKVMTKIRGKEFCVGPVINCLDDIMSDYNAYHKYSSDFLDKLVSIGALTKKFEHCYYDNEKTQEWLDDFTDCWSLAQEKVLNKKEKKKNV